VRGLALRTVRQLLQSDWWSRRQRARLPSAGSVLHGDAAFGISPTPLCWPTETGTSLWIYGREYPRTVLARETGVRCACSGEATRSTPSEAYCIHPHACYSHGRTPTRYPLDCTIATTRPRMLDSKRPSFTAMPIPARKP